MFVKSEYISFRDYKMTRPKVEKTCRDPATKTYLTLTMSNSEKIKSAPFLSKDFTQNLLKINFSGLIWCLRWAISCSKTLHWRPL